MAASSAALMFMAPVVVGSPSPRLRPPWVFSMLRVAVVQVAPQAWVACSSCVRARSLPRSCRVSAVRLAMFRTPVAVTEPAPEAVAAPVTFAPPPLAARVRAAPWNVPPKVTSPAVEVRVVAPAAEEVAPAAPTVTERPVTFRAAVDTTGPSRLAEPARACTDTPPPERPVLETLPEPEVIATAPVAEVWLAVTEPVPVTVRPPPAETWLSVTAPALAATVRPAPAEAWLRLTAPPLAVTAMAPEAVAWLAV